MPRAVFDTVVIVRVLINPRSVCGRLVFEHAEDYRLALSPPVVAEILEVLRRPEVTWKLSRLNQVDFRDVLDLIAQAEIVQLTTIPPVSRDPTDDKFLATAKAAKADYLVSEDKDLLVLGSYEGTQILTCHALLTILARR